MTFLEAAGGQLRNGIANANYLQQNHTARARAGCRPLFGRTAFALTDLREGCFKGVVGPRCRQENVAGIDDQTAGQDDLPSLLALYKHLHPDDETISPAVASNILAQFLRYPGSAIFLGLRDDAVVTTCTLIVIPNLTRGGAPYGLIENVVTDARHSQHGYGKVILKAAISAAWHHDCYKVMLLTGSKNPATLRFYQDVGFEQSKTGFQARRIPLREA